MNNNAMRDIGMISTMLAVAAISIGSILPTCRQRKAPAPSSPVIYEGASTDDVTYTIPDNVTSIGTSGMTMTWDTTSAYPVMMLYPDVNRLLFLGSDGETIGKLDWESGTMQFNGEADASAKMFFELVIKEYLNWKEEE